MQRRKFLKTVGAYMGSAAALLLGYPLLRFLVPPMVKAKAKKLTILKSDIPSGAAKEAIYNNTPIIVINRRGKGLIALSRVCTHFGCLVKYDRANSRLVCPCHAGNFTLEGYVISGPPPKPLPRIPLTVQGDKVLIG